MLELLKSDIGKQGVKAALQITASYVIEFMVFNTIIELAIQERQ